MLAILFGWVAELKILIWSAKRIEIPFSQWLRSYRSSAYLGVRFVFVCLPDHHLSPILPPGVLWAEV